MATGGRTALWGSLVGGKVTFEKWPCLVVARIMLLIGSAVRARGIMGAIAIVPLAFGLPIISRAV